MNKLKRYVAIVLAVLVLALSGTAFAGEVHPTTIPVECYLSPSQISITTSDPTALFHGQWAGGAVSTYYVYISYGDGTSESYYTTSNFGDFYHHYNTAGKSSGYTWTVTIKVSNGSGSSSCTSQVTLQ